MDKSKIKKAAQSLKWEQFYQELQSGKPEKRHFLQAVKQLDADFETAIKQWNIQGNLLDIGTGTGLQAIALARLGFRVTATDVSQTAIDMAIKKQEKAHTPVRFVKDNILYSELKEQFDCITDRGCYTLLPKRYKAEYVLTIQRLLKEKGLLLLKCDQKKGEQDVTDIFTAPFEIIEHQVSTYINQDNKEVEALFFVITRLN